MAIESLRQPHAKMTSFGKLMNELPNGMDSLYRQAMQALQVDDRQMLLVALRWLLCGKGEIDATLVADELEHTYEEEEEEDEYDEEESAGKIETRDFASTNDPSVIFPPGLSTSAAPPIENSGGLLEFAEQYDERSRRTIDDLKRIGREFLKFDSNIIGLQHNSVRDFIIADEKHMPQSWSTRCPECAVRFSQTSTHEASPKYGHLLMVENMFRKLNSSSFQKKFIFEEVVKNEDRVESQHDDLETQGLNVIFENLNQSNTAKKQEEAAHDEKSQPITENENIKPPSEDENAEPNIELDNTTDADPQDRTERVFDQPPEEVTRYELTHWPEHLRAAEQAWPEDERDLVRWDKIYSELETFLSPDSLVFKCWHKLRGLVTYDDPLHIAARYGITGLMQKYLDQGTNVDSLSENGDSALHLVCGGEGEFVGLEMLVEHGADVNLRTSSTQSTPLLLLLWPNTPLEKVRYLLKKGAKPEVPDQDMRTCLHYAAIFNKVELSKLLLSYDSVDVNAKDNWGETPLHWVFQWPNAPSELVKLLLSRGADVDAQDNDSQAPLYEACSVGNLEGARLLLDYGADVNDGEDVFGYTALHAAVSKGNLEIVKLLVNRGAELSRKNKQGRDPVSQAADEGENSILRFLLDAWKTQGTSMQFLLTPDLNGHTPLHRSAAKGHEEAVRILLNAGNASEICSQVNHNGSTPLHSAAHRGRAKVVQILAEHGADVGTRNANGKTPIDVALSGWKTADDDSSEAFAETIELLANIDSALAQQSDLFQFAIEKGAVQICRFLVKLTNDEDAHGWTPLLLAIQLQQHGIIRLLSPYDTKQLLDAFSTRKELSLGFLPMRWSPTDKAPRIMLSANFMELSCLSGKISPFRSGLIGLYVDLCSSSRCRSHDRASRTSCSRWGKSILLRDNCCRCCC